MKKLAYIVNMRDGAPQSLTVVISGKSYSLTRGHASFLFVINELKKVEPNADKILDMIDTKTVLTHFSADTLVKRGIDFFYNGQEVKNVLVDRIRDFMRLGISWKPMERFLDNVLKNPREHSQQFVYKFLENENLPLTPDGCFLGYKGVQSDFWSINTGHHTMIHGQQNEEGHIFNRLGEVVRVPYEEVVADPNQPCARGLHVGSYTYAKNWAGENGRVVLVQVNPKDVVSVPSTGKEVMRVCAYEVVDQVWGEPLKQKFESQYLKPNDPDATYYNVRDSKGRFTRTV